MHMLYSRDEFHVHKNNVGGVLFVMQYVYTMVQLKVYVIYRPL